MQKINVDQHNNEQRHHKTYTELMYPPRSQSPRSVPQPQRPAGRRRNVPHVLRFCEMSALPCLPHVKNGSNLGRAQGGISLRVKAKRASAYTGCQSTSNHLAKGGSYQRDLPCISLPIDSTPLLVLSQSQLLTLFAGGLGPSFEPLSHKTPRHLHASHQGL